MTQSVLPLDDQAARERIERSLDESLIVEAAAGTGKTTELVRRLVAVLQGGITTVDRIVAVTFTRKAAGELKLRLRQELDVARGRTDDADERRCLEQALARLEEAHIGTIHSFCAEILRERPVEAGIDPAFREIDEDEATRLYGRAFRSWIERKLDEMPPGLARALSRLAGERTRDASSPLDRLRDAGRSLVDWRDFPAPWRREPFPREAAIDETLAEVEAAAELCRQCPNRHDYLRRALEPAVAVATWVRRSQDVAPERDYHELEAQLIRLLPQLRRNAGWKGRGKWFAPGVAREEAVAVRDHLIGSLESFRRRADADLAALLRQELSEVIADYEELKRHAGRLDFLDLLVRARDLVRKRAEVRHFLQERFTHLFVDEFQDTDPLQAEILLLLAAADPEATDWRTVRPVPGKLFLVGDPKQSIYRFRRADVLLYQSIREQLTSAGVGLVHLTRSFRAVRPLQHAINGAFRVEMTRNRVSGQPDYVPLDHYRPASEEQPEIVALPAPEPYGWSRITAQAIEACLPDAVAAFVAWLINHSGWTVADPESGERVPIAPRHVSLLFRRFLSWGTDMTSDYVRSLEARGIAHLVVGGRSFHQREEVETLRAALTAVEWPDDELSVFAALRGSLLAIPDHLLLRFRSEYRSFHPFRQLPDDLPEDYLPIAEAMGLLARLHRQRNRVPIVETVHEILAYTRAHAGFALRPAGHQVLANVQRICDLARSFEVRGGLSFRGFVERLNEEAGRPVSNHGPILEEGAEGVRLLTVHSAKGLEFPVVVLADITARIAPAEPGLYVDAREGLCATRLLGCSPWELLDHTELELQRDRAEGVRLAYVAATRARDLLVVPAVGDQEWEGGWVSPLNKAIYPERDRYRWSEPAPGCPPFGDGTVLRRTPELDGQADGSVRPGLHRPQAGDHRVVWWDPGILELDVEGNFGVRQEEILRPDGAEEAVAEGLDRYEDWVAARREAIADGSRPALDVVAVTQAEEPPPDNVFEITVEKVVKAGRRPSGKRFGTLVHTVLRDVAFDAGEAAIRALAELHGRVLDAPADEIAAAVGSVAEALRHPVLRRAAAAERCHREAPFVLKVDDGTVVEGTIDLLFREGDGWVVLDFKTDAEIESLGERYRQQLEWYLLAVERLTSESVEGVLLAI